MQNLISQEELQELLNKNTQEVTAKVAGIKLKQTAQATSPELNQGADGLCTVYVDFNSGFSFRLSLCADMTLFTRLTQYMMQEDKIYPQDVEDFVKEYFNVLCGHIAAGLFQATHIAARFGLPHFQIGHCQPENMQKQITLSYASDRNEFAQLTNHLAVR